MQREGRLLFPAEVRMLAIFLPFPELSSPSCVLMARRYPMSTSLVFLSSSSTTAASPHCTSILMTFMSSISILRSSSLSEGSGLASIAARVHPHLSIYSLFFCRCVLAGVVLGSSGKQLITALYMDFLGRYPWVVFCCIYGGDGMRIRWCFRRSDNA